VAVAHAARRRAFGRPLREFQAVAHALAEAATRTQAARLLVYEAASRYDADPAAPGVTGAAAMAKLYATETAQAVVDQAVQVLGSQGPGARAPAGAPVPRGPCPPHLRGHLRDPARHHRPRAVPRYRGPATPRRGGTALSPFEGSAGRTERWEHFAYAEEAGVATVTFDGRNGSTPSPSRSTPTCATCWPSCPPGRGAGPGPDRPRPRASARAGRARHHRGPPGHGAPELLEFTRMTGPSSRACGSCPCRWWPPSTGSRPGPAPSSPWPPTSGCWPARPPWPFCSPGSGWPGRTWAAPTCCPGWSGWDGRPSCCCSGTGSTPTGRPPSAWPTRWSTTTG
jgi:hypothetical protein